MKPFSRAHRVLLRHEWAELSEEDKIAFECRFTGTAAAPGLAATDTDAGASEAPEASKVALASVLAHGAAKGAVQSRWMWQTAMKPLRTSWAHFYVKVRTTEQGGGPLSRSHRELLRREWAELSEEDKTAFQCCFKGTAVAPALAATNTDAGAWEAPEASAVAVAPVLARRAAEGAVQSGSMMEGVWTKIEDGHDVAGIIEGALLQWHKDGTVNDLVIASPTAITLTIEA